MDTYDDETPVPAPVTEERCSLCGEAWRPHIRVTRLYDEDMNYLGKSEEPVIALDCIRVLKDRFRGPVGPVGPIGATGRDGHGATTT